MSRLQELLDRAPAAWHVVVEVLHDQFSTWSGWVFLAAWVGTLLGGYALGRLDRAAAQAEKIRRARHGRRAAR